MLKNFLILFTLGYTFKCLMYKIVYFQLAHKQTSDIKFNNRVMGFSYISYSFTRKVFILFQCTHST